jgi:hypothetical protein
LNPIFASIKKPNNQAQGELVYTEKNVSAVKIEPATQYMISNFLFIANLSASIPRGGLVKATTKDDIDIPILQIPLLERFNPAIDS